jgi:hypothetical protein
LLSSSHLWRGEASILLQFKLMRGVSFSFPVHNTSSASTYASGAQLVLM